LISFFVRFISFALFNKDGDVSSSIEGGRSLSDAGDAVVEVEFVARVDPGPIRSAATSPPSNAAIAVIKPAIAVNIPGMELQNPPAAFSSPMMSPPRFGNICFSMLV